MRCSLTLMLTPAWLFLYSPGLWASKPPAVPPASFAVPQSEPLPAPFPIEYVDQGQYDSKLTGLFAPKGFRIDIVADAPTVINPVAIHFGPDGTLYVAEWAVDPVTGSKWFEFKETFRYRDGSTKQVATMRKFTADVIKVLKLDSQRGMYKEAQPIISEELPSTLLWHDGWLYTAGRGTVRRYRTSRPGGPWDVRETIAQGFCGFHHHQVSGLTIGLDGKLYITSGDDDNFVEGSDGSRVNVLRTGAIFRCNPDGSAMEEFSRGWRNPYRDLAFDDKYNFFHADNDNEDGSKFTGCRLMHVPQGVDYGWRLKIGARCCRPDFLRGAVAGELPGKLPPMLKTGRGAPAGLLLYHDQYLPQAYQGLMFYPDVFRKNVRAYQLRPRGSSFEISHEFEFLKSDDPLFRPCQMIVGPDGAMYLCDWRTDSGGAGRLSGDGIHGRIYRIRWIGDERTPELPLRALNSWGQQLALPTVELVEQLNSPNLTDRVEVRKELVRRGDEARAKVLKALISGKLNQDGKLAALGVLRGGRSPEVEDYFRLLLKDESADVRRLAVEALATQSEPASPRNFEATLALLNDDDLAVRRAAALALARLGSPGTADVLLQNWLADDHNDAFLQDGYLRALESLGSIGIDAVRSLAFSGSDAQLARAVEAFCAMRSPAAADALLSLLNHPHLKPQQQAALLTSYVNYQFDPALPIGPIVTWLRAQPSAPAIVKIAGLDLLSGYGTNEQELQQYIVDSLADALPEVRYAALEATEVVQPEQASTKLIARLNDATLPLPERAAVLKALRTVAGKSALPTLIALLQRDEPLGLKLDALKAVQAASPAEAQTLATNLLVSGEPRLVNEAATILATTRQGTKLLAEKFIAKELPRELFPRISEALQKFPKDTELARLHDDVLKGGLLLSFDSAARQQLVQTVQNQGNPERGKAIYLDTKLVACASCHRMEGVGGAVGPDLTRLWGTHSLDKLLESILEPSKEIKEGYQSYVANTFDGRNYSGLKVFENEREIVLREANGRDTRLLKADLEALNTTSISLMPDNAIAQLNFEQFVDLLAFLRSQSAQESLRGTVLEFKLSVLPRSELFDRAKPLKLSSESEVAAMVKAAVEPSGRLELSTWLPTGSNLNGTLGRGANGAKVILYVYSEQPQAVKLKLQADDTVRVNLEDKEIYHKPLPMIPFARPTNVTMDAYLPAGWSTVVIAHAAQSKAPWLSLQLLGENLRITATPEPR